MTTEGGVVTRLFGRTVVLLDVHQVWLDTLAARLEALGMEVLAATSELDDAVRAVRQLRPDVFVVGITGIETLDALRRERDATQAAKTVVFSGDERPETVDAALQAGASAYVLKTALPDDIGMALRQLFERQLFLATTNNGASRRTAAKSEKDLLTRREVEILSLAAKGMSNASMARKLWVTEQTVKFHLSNIYRKLGVANRTEAARWALERGVLVASSDEVQAYDAADKHSQES
jgi:DNA-binding NarL/FixJ family response regulator